MREFTKVSVHNHFGGKGADRLYTENVTKSLSFELNEAFDRIDDAKSNGYQLLAMTQSNAFDPASYIITRNYASKLDINLIPGVELNVKNTNDRYMHVVVVFDTRSDIFDISLMLLEMIQSNQRNLMSLDQFLELIVSFKCIIIPHGIKQNGRSSASNPEILSELISLSDSIPVVLEDNKKYHKEQLKAKIGNILTEKESIWLESAVSISCADRKGFSEIDSPTYIWGSSTFDDLYYSCFMADSRIKREKDIINKVNFISRIEIDNSSKTQIHTSVINCSHGLNTIIGPSGSGKTLLLDVIKRKLTGKSLDNKSISKDCDYSKVYDLNDVKIFDREGNLLTNESGYEVVEGELLYTKIISAYQADKKQMLQELGIKVNFDRFNSLINNFNFEINKYCKARLKIESNRNEMKLLLSNINSSYLFLSENSSIEGYSIEYIKNESVAAEINIIKDTLNELDKDILKFESNFDALITIASKYNFKDALIKDISKFREKGKNTLSKRTLEVRIRRSDLEIINTTQMFIFDNVQRYNNKVGQQSSLVLGRKQDLMNYFQDLKELLFENVKLAKGLIIPKLNLEDLLNSITVESSDYVRLSIEETNLKFDKEGLKDYFPNNIGNTPKVNKSKFSSNTIDFGSEISLKQFLDIFIQEKYTEQLYFLPKPEDILTYKIELKNVENMYENINNISAGNLGKIYISRMFENKINTAGSNVIILYDQPDSNMEKAFILNELVPRISALRDKYQVFITTHEPLLVVNADSNNIIAVSNEKTIEKENDVKYMNKSFAGVNSKADLVLEVAELIDGHPNAIKIRNTIYGGLLNAD